MWKKIQESVEANREKILNDYNELRAKPEVSYQEHETSSYLKKQIYEYADRLIEIHDTGFLADLDTNKKGPSIGLKVDMDALPFVDEQGKSYNLHTCGHDAHCTIGLWVLKLLRELDLIKKGKFRVIFQPGEEKLTGASIMAKKGAVKGLDKLYGLHLRPKSELELYQAAPALLHSGSVRMNIQFYGKSAHSARPHLGINSIDAAVMAINGIKFIEWDPIPHSSINITRIYSNGEADNIIPSQTNLTVDIRAGNNEDLNGLKKKVELACESGAFSVNAGWEVKSEINIPASEYSEDTVQHLEESIKKVLGNKVEKPFITAGSDDFHVYKTYNRSLETAFLALGADLKPGLHDPNMTFNLEAIMIGIKILAGTIADQLN